MIAADTSTWIPFFGGQQGEDVTALTRALEARQVVMPPPVLTELLSDPTLSPSVARTLLELPLMELKDGFWHRAGKLRAKVLARKSPGAQKKGPARGRIDCAMLHRCRYFSHHPGWRFQGIFPCDEFALSHRM